MNLRNIVLGKRGARINYMMINSIYKKPEMTNHKSVIAWGQGLGRLLQKDIKKCLGLIMVIVTSVYTIAEFTKLYTYNG